MRYFTADLHFGHQKVADIRTGADINLEFPVELMDERYLKALSSVKRGDQVWILGDLSSGRMDAEEKALNYIQDVKEHTGAQYHLIAGNHDSVSSIHQDAWKRQKRFLEVFDSVQNFAKLRFGAHRVLLSHFPYKILGDGPGRKSVRYLEFRLPDEGFPLIHGHTHQPLPTYVHTIDNQYCVSWDAHDGLVKEDEILDWLDMRSLYKETIDRMVENS